jgi:uncharacterized protein (TIGR02145 family)
MKNLSKMAMLLAIAGLAAVLFSCTSCSNKGSESLSPAVGGTTVSNITQTGATVTITILADGGAPITGQGATINNVKRYPSDAFGSKNFTVTITDLSPNTEYSVRGYASNSVGAGYGDEVKFTTADIPTVKDYDGNLYHLIIIGTQKWIKPNFHGTHYLNGDPISNVTDNVTWSKLTTGAYRYYNDDSKNADVYGILYNFYVGADPRGLIQGFHTPTDEDGYIQLISFLGGYQSASWATMEQGTSHWTTTFSNINNSSGLTILPAGGFFPDNIGNWTFSNKGESAYFWTKVLFGGRGIGADISAPYFNFGSDDVCNQADGLSLRLVSSN